MSPILSTLSIIFWFIVVLIPLVVIHEFGHLVMSRLTGVKVLEFGIGLPFSRRLFFRKWKGIVWSFYPWLLGGFVRPYGDTDALDEANETMKTDPALARQEYLGNRARELIQNRDLQFFLEENYLDFNQDWQWFEKVGLSLNGDNMDKALLQNVKYLPSGEAPKMLPGEVEKLEGEQKEHLTRSLQTKFESQMQQLETLIDWEFDAKLTSKTAPKDAFFMKKWWQQTLIIAGGVTFNMISAVLFFWAMFGLFGSTQQILNMESQSGYFKEQIQALEKDNRVQLQSPNLILLSVAKDSAMDKAGLKSQDELLQLGPDKLDNVQNLEQLNEMIQQYKGQKVDLTYKSKETGETKTVSLEPQEVDGKVRLGMTPGYVFRYYPKNSLSSAFKETGRIFGLTWEGLKDLVVAILPQTQDRSALDNAAGPIAVGRVSSRIFDEEGVRGLLYLMGAVSISLAVFNMLPIPALDGGRFLILTVNRLTGRRNKKLETAVIGATFMLMLGLAVLVAFKDVGSIFSGKI